MAEALDVCPNKPNCVSSLPNEAEKKRVEPITWKTDDPVAVIRALNDAVQSAGNTKIVQQSDALWHIEYRSKILKFVDDVVIQFNWFAKMAHIKSSSRTGYYDFGVNRRRVEAIKTKFSEASL